jgi:hypothetical protein
VTNGQAAYTASILWIKGDSFLGRMENDSMRFQKGVQFKTHKLLISRIFPFNYFQPAIDIR